MDKLFQKYPQLRGAFTKFHIFLLNPPTADMSLRERDRYLRDVISALEAEGVKFSTQPFTHYMRKGKEATGLKCSVKFGNYGKSFTIYPQERREEFQLQIEAAYDVVNTSLSSSAR